METFFNYETAKQTLVLTAYMALIIFDFWWMGYLIISAVKWVVKKVKALFKKKNTEKENKEEINHE